MTGATVSALYVVLTRRLAVIRLSVCFVDVAAAAAAARAAASAAAAAAAAAGATLCAFATVVRWRARGRICSA